MKILVLNQHAVRVRRRAPYSCTGILIRSLDLKLLSDGIGIGISRIIGISVHRTKPHVPNLNLHVHVGSTEFIWDLR